MRSGRKTFVSRPASRAWAVLAAMTIATVSPPALACGWWGDAEAVASREAQGGPVTDTGFAAAAAVPAGGYGLAVLGRSAAVPYREATSGAPAATVEDMAALGFEALVDLTPEAAEADEHRQRTGSVLRYVHLGADAEVPDPGAVAAFSKLVEEADLLPLLVYAPRPEALGTLWALHLMDDGLPPKEAVQAARRLGLTRQAESVLWWHLRNGLLKDSRLGGSQ